MLALGFLVLLSGCTTQSPAPGPGPLVQLHFSDGASVLAEVADTPDKRARGLMFRDSLEEGRGMWFPFGEDRPWGFWMKNVKFPIDMVWVDRNFTIVHIEKSVPPCRAEPCPSYVPGAPARYVAEVQSGFADNHRLRVGDAVRVEP